MRKNVSGLADWVGYPEESAGRAFEDFVAGQRFAHRPGRTISETDNSWFTLLTMNTHPLHFDAEYARHQHFEKIVVNSCLTLSMVVGMSVRDVSQRAVANLGWTDIKLTVPVFVGDTIYAASEILEVRESRKHADAGIVRVRTEGLKASGESFMTFERSILMACRSARPVG
ncbi:MAG: MaoC family dehydratase [Pseudomonadota bacterium]